jgi:HEAT repeat protein
MDSLVVAVDDADPQARATALDAIAVVAENEPGAVTEGVRRVIGRLDDDSSIVRERAAGVIMAVADQEPGLVVPAPEASDRLRRLQRDPAVDIDAEALQAAATAVQTGTPAGETAEVANDDTAIWTPESPDEMGSSGDTRVFDPSSTGDDDDLPEGTCPGCGADLRDAGGPDTCPECGTDLE